MPTSLVSSAISSENYKKHPETYTNIAKNTARSIGVAGAGVVGGLAISAGGLTIAGLSAVSMPVILFLGVARSACHTYSKLPDHIKEPVSRTVQNITASRVVQAVANPCYGLIGRFEEKYGQIAHSKMVHNAISRNQKPDSYPARQSVPNHQTSWSIPFTSYQPEYYVAPAVLDNDRTTKAGGWADPETLPQLDTTTSASYRSFEGKVELDHRGLPLNPEGRTGLEGRGSLGKWGANFAADPLVTRLNPKTNRLEVLLIQRADSGQWALPGGMVDSGETVVKTLARELGEETGAKLDFDKAPIVYKGYVDDRRNTDNAWIETTIAHIHLNPSAAAQIKLKAGSDAAKAEWVEVTPSLTLYASHKQLIQRALSNFSDAYVPQEIQHQIASFK